MVSWQVLAFKKDKFDACRDNVALFVIFKTIVQRQTYDNQTKLLRF